MLNGERLRIGVWDTGVGIAPEHRDTIFAEYYQIEKPGRDRSKARWLKSVGWLSPSSRQALVKRRIRDRRDAELDPSIRQHDDELRTAPQIEMRKQMTDVFPYRNVLEPHS